MISKENFDIISQTCWAREYDSCTCHNHANPHAVCDYRNCPQFLYSRYEKRSPLTPKEFEDELAKIHKKYLIDVEDEEVCHIEMDNLIHRLLIDLGYEEGVYIFEHTKKWYA